MYNLGGARARCSVVLVYQRAYTWGSGARGLCTTSGPGLGACVQPRGSRPRACVQPRGSGSGLVYNLGARARVWVLARWGIGLVYNLGALGSGLMYNLGVLGLGL